MTNEEPWINLVEVDLATSKSGQILNPNTFVDDATTGCAMLHMHINVTSIACFDTHLPIRFHLPRLGTKPRLSQNCIQLFLF